MEYAGYPTKKLEEFQEENKETENTEASSYTHVAQRLFTDSPKFSLFNVKHFCFEND